jgi:hypothetical protein
MDISSVLVVERGKKVRRVKVAKLGFGTMGAIRIM